LRILILPTCVGFRYGLRKLKLRSFSWTRDISSFALKGLVLGLNVASPDLPKETASTLSPGQPTPGLPNLLRPSIALARGAGILTSFPSDRKSTRLNSSHVKISYAVFCLKKKKNTHQPHKH